LSLNLPEAQGGAAPVSRARRRLFCLRSSTRDRSTRGFVKSTPGSATDAGTSSACVLDPNLTKGPYWVDERLDRSDVDIWHCDASGIYSDVQGVTAGQNFLRGYQVTDANGLATFTTIYPGWYSGRAVHIHVKVRLFDASNNTTTEATTQVFFDDALTDAVYAGVSPYSTRSSRDTRNAADNIYANQTVLLLALQGDTTSGYSGSISLGVQVGQVSAG